MGLVKAIIFAKGGADDLKKDTLIESGAYQAFKELKRQNFKLGLDTRDKSNYPFTEEDTKALMRIYENHKKRNQRMYEKLLSWLFAMEYIPSYKNYYIIFATLTFTDKDLEKTTKETRRQYVFRYLKSVSENYIANVDFGDKNGREHYHALLFVKDKLNPKDWKKGFSFYEEVIFKNNDYIKIIKYMNKLTNHSFKNSNKLDKVIYDRNNLIYKMETLFAPNLLRKYKIKYKRSYL